MVVNLFVQGSAGERGEQGQPGPSGFQVSSQTRRPLLVYQIYYGVLTRICHPAVHRVFLDLLAPQVREANLETR